MKPDRDLMDRLEASVEIAEQRKTRRGIRCMCGCGAVYINAEAYFVHTAPLRHPAAR